MRDISETHFAVLYSEYVKRNKFNENGQMVSTWNIWARWVIDGFSKSFPQQLKLYEARSPCFMQDDKVQTAGFCGWSTKSWKWRKMFIRYPQAVCWQYEQLLTIPGRQKNRVIIFPVEEWGGGISCRPRNVISPASSTNWPSSHRSSVESERRCCTSFEKSYDRLLLQL